MVRKVLPELLHVDTTSVIQHYLGSSILRVIRALTHITLSTCSLYLIYSWIIYIFFLLAPLLIIFRIVEIYTFSSVLR